MKEININKQAIFKKKKYFYSCTIIDYNILNVYTDSGLKKLPFSHHLIQNEDGSIEIIDSNETKLPYKYYINIIV